MKLYEKRKKLIVYLTVVTLIITLLDGMFISPTVARAADYGVSNPVVSNGVSVWDTIFFGSYYQSSKTEKEPIRWRVLSVEGDDAFLLSEYVLDRNKAYSDMAYQSVTWETSTLRSWLNAYGADANVAATNYDTPKSFINAAFTAEERAAINTASIATRNNPEYTAIVGGNTTRDKIFCLSLEELCNASYGFNTSYATSSETRKAKPTKYAGIGNRIDETEEESVYWIRTPGAWSTYACYVRSSGKIDVMGNAATGTWLGVRPALHISLSSSVWTKGEPISSRIGDTNSKPSKKPTTQNQTQNDVAPAGTDIRYAKSIKTRKVKLSWISVPGVTGYEIQYALNKQFTKSKKTLNKNANTISMNVSKLKKGKTYYFRIRSYKTIGTKKLYSTWSAVRKVKVRK